MQDSSLINKLISISIDAGEILMKHRKSGIKVKIKLDNSPVTLADQDADDFITTELLKISDIKIVSEEGSKNNLPTEKSFWLVDPLDGTKSFIKGEGEFTVNIGLIENNKAKLGVIYQPVGNKLWYTGLDGKAYFRETQGETVQINVNNKSISDPLVVVASKSHLSEATEKYLETLKVESFRSTASSLKFCLVADGDADFYPRLAPTMQWDTAAGHAILNAAGGSVINPDGSEFTYVIDVNDKESLRNGHFIARGWS